MTNQSGKYTVVFPDKSGMEIEADAWTVQGDVVTLWRDEEGEGLAPLPTRHFIGCYKFISFFLMPGEEEGEGAPVQEEPARGGPEMTP